MAMAKPAASSRSRSGTVVQKFVALTTDELIPECVHSLQIICIPDYSIYTPDACASW